MAIYLVLNKNLTEEEEATGTSRETPQMHRGGLRAASVHPSANSLLALARGVLGPRLSGCQLKKMVVVASTSSVSSSGARKPGPPKR